MAEDLQITEGSKEEKYQSLIPQIKGLVDGETDVTANLANICAALKSTFHFFWVGFYQVKEDQLCWDRFRVRWLVPVSDTEKGCAALPGKRLLRNWFPM